MHLQKIYMCVFKVQDCDTIPNVLYVYFLVKVSDLHILLVNNIILYLIYSLRRGYMICISTLQLCGIQSS